MTNFKRLGLAVLLAMASGCGTATRVCTAAGCANGCCSSDNRCLPGTAATACGTAGNACAVCQASQSCALGACQTIAAAGGGASGGGAAGGGTAGGGTAGGSTAGGSSAGGSAGGGSAAGGAAGGATAGGAPSGVVINEIYGAGNNVGTDYVELFNPGPNTVDLSGFSVADTENTDGGPKPRDTAPFPSGTTLPPNTYLLVVGDRSSSGPSTDCLGDGGVPACFQAKWGISQGNGEKLWLLDAQGSVVLVEQYPQNGAVGPASYGRLPNGTGAFQSMTATPGAPNVP